MRSFTLPSRLAQKQAALNYISLTNSSNSKGSATQPNLGLGKKSEIEEPNPTQPDPKLPKLVFFNRICVSKKFKFFL